jgi:hypothetical protein
MPRIVRFDPENFVDFKLSRFFIDVRDPAVLAFDLPGSARRHGGEL